MASLTIKKPMCVEEKTPVDTGSSYKFKLEKISYAVSQNENKQDWATGGTVEGLFDYIIVADSHGKCNGKKDLFIKKTDRPFVKGVLQVGSMYFVSGSFGVSTRVIQLNVRRSHNMVGSGVNYVSTRDTESMVLKAIDDSEKAYAEKVENETTSYTAAQDSEDEDEEEVEQEAAVVEPEPVVEEKPKKKKVVRRKKKVSKA